MVDGQSQTTLVLPEFNARVHPVTKRTTRIGPDFFQGGGDQGLSMRRLEPPIAILRSEPSHGA